MKAFHDRIRLITFSFQEVWKVDRGYFLFNIFLVILTPIQLNASIYLSSQVLDELSSQGLRLFHVISLVVIMIGLELIVILLNQWQIKQNLSFTENFNIRQNTRLLDYLME